MLVVELDQYVSVNMPLLFVIAMGFWVTTEDWGLGLQRVISKHVLKHVVTLKGFGQEGRVSPMSTTSLAATAPFCGWLHTEPLTEHLSIYLQMLSKAFRVPQLLTRDESFSCMTVQPNPSNLGPEGRRTAGFPPSRYLWVWCKDSMANQTQ